MMGILPLAAHAAFPWKGQKCWGLILLPLRLWGFCHCLPGKHDQILDIFIGFKWSMRSTGYTVTKTYVCNKRHIALDINTVMSFKCRNKLK